MLASDFQMDNHPTAEVPCDCEVLGALRTRTNHELSVRRLLYELNGWHCAYVLEFWMRNSPEISPSAFIIDLLLLHFENRSILFLQLKSILL